MEEGIKLSTVHSVVVENLADDRQDLFFRASNHEDIPRVYALFEELNKIVSVSGGGGGRGTEGVHTFATLSMSSASVE